MSLVIRCLVACFACAAYVLMSGLPGESPAIAPQAAVTSPAPAPAPGNAIIAESLVEKRPTSAMVR